MSTQSFNHRVVLELVTCCKCGVVFGVEERMLKNLRRQGKNAKFFCTNGHLLTYGESEEDRLKRQIAAKDAQLASAREEMWALENRRRQAKAALTRLSNRVAYGVCPCCNRHFDNLQRHIATKHPDFLKTSDSAGEQEDYQSQEKLLGVPPSELITTYEAAQLKNCVDITVRNAIRRKRLPAVMIKGRFFVRREDVLNWKVGNYGSRRTGGRSSDE